MRDEIKEYISEIKSLIADCPRDQTASFVNGILQGLDFAAVVASKADYEIVKDEQFSGFAEYLAVNTPPVKKRKNAIKLSSQEQLFLDVKQFVRFSIASRLKIWKQDYDKSLDAEDLVNRCLLTVIAIGNREALDDAIQDIIIVRSIVGGGPIERETVKDEVEDCYQRFPMEVAAIGKMREMNRHPFEAKDVWANLRGNVQIGAGYEQDLEEIDARYRLK